MKGAEQDPDAGPFPRAHPRLRIARDGRAAVPLVGGCLLLVVLLVSPSVSPNPSAPAAAPRSPISADLAPLGAAFAPGTAYVAETFDGFSGQLLPGTTPGLEGEAALSAVYDPVNQDIYFTNAFSGASAIGVINSTANAVAAAIPLPTGGSDGGADTLAIDPSAGFLYVGSYDSDYVSVINTTSGDLVRTVALGTNISRLVVDTTDHRLFAASDQKAGRVDVLSTATDAVLPPILVGAWPTDLAYDPVDDRLFAVASGPRLITVINASSCAPIANYSGGPAAVGAAYDTHNGHLFVVNPNPGPYLGPSNVWVLNATTGSLIANASIPEYYPYHALYVPQWGAIVVTNGGGTWPILNDTNNSLVSNYQYGGGGNDAAYDASNNHLYLPGGRIGVYTGPSNVTLVTNIVVDESAGDLAYDYRDHRMAMVDQMPYDALDAQIFSTLPVQTLTHLHVDDGTDYTTYDPSDGNFYVFEYNQGAVALINGSNSTPHHSVFLCGGYCVGQGVFDPPLNAVVAAVGTGLEWISSQWGGQFIVGSKYYPQGVAYDPLSRFVYMSFTGRSFVSIVDTVNATLVRNATVGLHPYGMAYDPASRTMYVANEDSGNVSVLNASTGAVVGSVRTGGYPYEVAYDPATNEMVVTSYNQSVSRPLNLSVINATTNQFVENLSTGDQTTGLVYANDTRTLYVSNVNSALLSMVRPRPAGPAFLSTSVSPGIGVVGKPVAIRLNASGGSGSLTYAYSGLPAGCASANRSSLNCTATTSGTFRVTATVSDATGRTALANVTLVILPRLNASAAPRLSGTAEVGRPFFLLAEPTGGLGPYQINWTTLPTGCRTPSGPAVFCNVTSTTGTLSVRFTVTDAANETGTSAWLNASIVPPLVAGLTASRNSLDIGQSVNFTGTSSGGTGTRSYSWSGLPTGCPGGNVTVVHCTPSTAGNDTVWFTVNDPQHPEGASAQTVVDVLADPTIGSLTAAPNGSIDAGQSVSFSVKVQGGRPAYSYAWSGLPSGCSGTSSATVGCQPTSSGVFRISVNVSDSNRFVVASPMLSYTVNPTLAAGGLAANRTSADVGQSVGFQVSAWNGSGGYVYTWHDLPTGCSGGGILVSCTPTGSGTFPVSVTVTDSDGGTVTTSSLSFPVDPDPSVGPPTASSWSGDVGQSVSFTVRAQGGSGGYSYAWSGLPAGCADSVAATVTCRLTALGETSLSVRVNDSNGYSVVSSSLEFETFSDPLVVGPTASRPSADLGQGVAFWVNVTNGSGGFSYEWSGLPAGCTVHLANATCVSLTAPGRVNVSVRVTDLDGFAVNSTVLAFATFRPPALSEFRASRTSLDLGQPVEFQADVSNGSGGTTYDWSGLPPGCAGGPGPTVDCVPTAAGNFPVTVSANDSNGARVASAHALVLVVDPDPSVRVSARPDALDVGQTLVLVANASAGSGGFQYAWIGLPSGCPGSGPQVRCQPSAPRDYPVTVSVNDSNGGTASASALVEVAADVSLTVQPTLARGEPGEVLTFWGNATGGTGTVAIAWAFGDGQAGQGSPARHVYSEVGRFTVKVWANDSVGISASRSLIVNVTSPPLSPTSVASLPAWALATAGLAGAAVVAAAVLLHRRRRRVPPEMEELPET
jgi:YVTN family beta-propeller protein